MLIAGTIQAKAQCDCDPILTGGETVITASDIVTAFSGASSVSGGIYQVTTDLTINTNFTITGSARFSVDPGVSIIVAPGYTLTITGSSILTAADDEMWAGIEELRLVKEEDEALTVYPVPANDLLYVSNLSVDQGTMLVYDLSGRIVLSYHFSTDNPVHHIALSSIESGVYLLVVLDQTGKQVGETSFSKQ
ncbi:MAG: T9SS type A sorting domain-containing protein [Chitinophagales bacterium]